MLPPSKRERTSAVAHLECRAKFARLEANIRELQERQAALEARTVLYDRCLQAVLPSIQLPLVSSAGELQLRAAIQSDAIVDNGQNATLQRNFRQVVKERERLEGHQKDVLDKYQALLNFTSSVLGEYRRLRAQSRLFDFPELRGVPEKFCVWGIRPDPRRL